MKLPALIKPISIYIRMTYILKVNNYTDRWCKFLDQWVLEPTFWESGGVGLKSNHAMPYFNLWKTLIYIYELFNCSYYIQC